MSLLIRKPDSNQMQADRLQRYVEDFNWIQDNIQNLTARYTKKYIAVKDRKVEYQTGTMDEMIQQIKSDSREVTDYIITYMHETSQSLIF